MAAAGLLPHHRPPRLWLHDVHLDDVGRHYCVPNEIPILEADDS